jgi:hypothetical protein
MTGPNEALAKVAETLRAEFDTAEARVNALEAELIEARGLRSSLNKALIAIDPTWESIDHRSGPKVKERTRKRKAGDWHISDGRVAEILEAWQASFGTEPFTAVEAQPVAELHITSVHKLLSKLHDQGRIQLDHFGGPRNSTKYWRLPAAGGDNEE